MSPLAGYQRRFLRGLANPRKPLVQVGESGLTPGVVAAVDAALDDHELVKVRLRAPQDKKATARDLAAASGAEVCGVLGHTVLLYRRHPENPRITLPRRSGSGPAEA